MTSRAQIVRSSTLSEFPRPPWSNGDRKDWITVRKFSEFYGRHPNTIYRWMRDGTLSEFGFRWYQDFKGKVWIKCPTARS